MHINEKSGAVLPELTAEQLAVVEAVKLMDGVSCRQNGSWLWISGDTRPHREALKNLGCRWSAKKGEWHCRPPSSKSAFYHRGGASRSYIRGRYGERRLVGEEA